MATAIPVLCLLDVNESKIGVVHQRSGLQSLSRLLFREPRRGQLSDDQEIVVVWVFRSRLGSPRSEKEFVNLKSAKTGMRLSGDYVHDLHE